MSLDKTIKPSADTLAEGIREKLALYQQNVGRSEFKVSESSTAVYIGQRVKKEIPEEEIGWLG